MHDRETPPGHRIKSPLLYQLSYRDGQQPSTTQIAHHTPTKTAGVGDEIGVIARAGQLLNYNPDSGELTWKVARRKCRVGAPAGSITREGYLRVDLCGQTLQGHRIAWMLMTGTTPPTRIDHINGDRADNRWANLRAASAVENAWNSAQAARATGVWRRYGKIYSRIRHAGAVHSAGPFTSAAEATAWYRAMAAYLRGAWTPAQRSAA